MKLNTLTKLSALSLSLFSASALSASDHALLDLLVKKGVLSSTEATEVAAELKDASGISFSAKGKETTKLRFNGRMQFQYDALSAEDNGADVPSTNHFYFRRLFLGAKASLENGIYAETVLDFAGDENPELAFDKAIIGYKFNDALVGALGFQKVPFGYEETSSSSKLPTIERSAVNRFFADDIDFASRHTGLHAKGNLGGCFSYAAAVVNGVQGEGSKLGGGSSNGHNDLAVYGRLQYKTDAGLLVGADAGQNSNNTKVSGNDVTAYTTYANYKKGGLDLLGEYFSGDLSDEGDVDGYAVRIAYKNGKFEPVFRYSYIKADEFGIDTDELIRRAPPVGISGTDSELTSYYFGLNYYPSKATSFMVGYEIAEAENKAKTEKNEIDGLRARLQVLW
jgi:phosphate-selective porin